MPKVAIYCRLSVEDRNSAENGESASIQNQKAMLRDYCLERCWEIFDIYVDDGYSGIDRSRPEFNRMLRDCENGRINIVLCKDQSRFSRDTVVIEQYINDRFLEWGIRFIGVADNADTESESYGTMRLFTSAYNEMYVRDISSKIRRTLAYKREQGQFVGSFAPYGYKTAPEDKHRLVIDEEAADVVKSIFEMYVSGVGYRRIVQKLNADGVPSPAEYKRRSGSRYANVNADSSSSKGLWTQSTIARILANEVYTGTLAQGKSHHISYKNKKRKRVDEKEWVRITDAHEAIIDAETWSNARKRLDSRARAGRTSQELSPLAGKVKCAVCKRPMLRNVYYNKSRTIRYYGLQCATCRTGAMNCANKASISGLILERKILDELNGIVEQYCQTDMIRLADIYSEQVRQIETELEKLDKRHTAAENRLVTAYKDRLDGVISDEEYSVFRQSLSDEEHELSKQIDELTERLTSCKGHIMSNAEQKSLIEKFTRFEKLDRITADEFIDCIEIGMTNDDGFRDIHIHWRL